MPHKFVLMGISVLIVLTVIVLGCNSATNLATNVATSQTNTAIVTGKVYHHISNISMGYYYGEGFKHVNKEWVLAGKEGIIYFILKPRGPSKPQNYTMILYYMPYEKVGDPLERSKIYRLLRDVSISLSENDYSLLQRKLAEIEKSFPPELKATIIKDGKELGLLYSFEYLAKEEKEIPIKVKAPLGKITRKHVILIIVLEEISSKGAGYRMFYAYINPQP
ncbi:MAG: hypothetical protein J7J78_03850 [Thermoprotei archaeon]|nr:hypothetical protein [Thermoprotei archaeon]